MPFSHHSHSGQFCKHATGTLEEVVHTAINQGFSTYCLTEHAPRYQEQDLYPEEIELAFTTKMLMKQFAAFLDEAHRLKRLYSSQIHLLVGLETERIHRSDLHKLNLLLEKHKSSIDFVVGSIHHVHELPIDFDKETYLKALQKIPCDDATDFARQEAFLLKYFEAQYDLLFDIKPEVVGHFDLCRLYEPGLHLQKYPRVWGSVKKNIEFAIGYGALFEVNAAAFRKGWDSAYPGMDVMELLVKRKARLTLSDDSHGPHMVGLNYDKLRAYLVKCGVTEIWYLESSEENTSGRTVQAVPCYDWASDPFWSKKHPYT